jgi:hypothetical protein
MALGLAGCAKNIDNLDAVKQGVLRDIPKDVNVGAMDVNVVSVSFRGNEADATVSFAPKGGAPMMSMKYTMEKKSGEWHIKERASGDLQKHAAQAPPSGDAGGAMGSAPAGGQQLPPGHPPMGSGDAGSTMPMPMPKGGAGSSGNMPPGHPPIGSN